MRSDESQSKRETDCTRLKAYLEQFPTGHFHGINVWYEAMAKLGLAQSHRQRLSDLRAQGLWMDFDKKKKGYVYEGFHASGQLTLFKAA
jgi:hypothetical protein